MEAIPKNKKTFSFSRFVKKRYLPIYITVCILTLLLSFYFIMDQTSFAKDTAVRNYLEEIGVVQESSTAEELDSEQAQDDVNLETETSDEENEDEDGEQTRDEIDSANKVENPEEGDGSQEGGIISTEFPTILSAKDGLGNVNYNSFGQEDTWYWKRPSIKVGEAMNLSINSNNPNDSTLYYKFEYQAPGGSFQVLQNWSTDKTFDWTVPSEALGRWLYIMVLVKDSDGELRFDGCDDYTYLVYEVNPKAVAQKIYPVISSAGDSKGNINTNSLGGNEGLSWSDGEIRSLNVGESVAFSINASDPNGDAMQYMFMIQPDGGSFDVLRGWSSSNTFTWTIPEELADTKVYIMASVKDGDSYYLFGDSGDDYTYLIYNID
jgi:hypothetical protein